MGKGREGSRRRGLRGIDDDDGDDDNDDNDDDDDKAADVLATASLMRFACT